MNCGSLSNSKSFEPTVDEFLVCKIHTFTIVPGVPKKRNMFENCNVAFSASKLLNDSSHNYST